MLYPLPEGSEKWKSDAFIKGRVTSRVTALRVGTGEGFCYGLRNPEAITNFAQDMLIGIAGPHPQRMMVQVFGPWIAKVIKTDLDERAYLQSSRAFFQQVLLNLQERKLKDDETNWLRITNEGWGTVDFGFSFSADGSPRFLILYDQFSGGPLTLAPVEALPTVEPDLTSGPPPV